MYLQVCAFPELVSYREKVVNVFFLTFTDLRNLFSKNLKRSEEILFNNNFL